MNILQNKSYVESKKKQHNCQHYFFRVFLRYVKKTANIVNYPSKQVSKDGLLEYCCQQTWGCWESPELIIPWKQPKVSKPVSYPWLTATSCGGNWPAEHRETATSWFPNVWHTWPRKKINVIGSSNSDPILQPVGFQFASVALATRYYVRIYPRCCYCCC